MPRKKTATVEMAAIRSELYKGNQSTGRHHLKERLGARRFAAHTRLFSEKSEQRREANSLKVGQSIGSAEICLKSLCSQETLAVRRTVMPDMLRGNEYIQYLFARNQRWLLGHVTEHFLPDELYEALADDYCATHKGVDRDSLTRIHMLNKSILESMDIQLLLYENTMSDFAVTGTLDFYNSKVQLTPEQRLQCMEYAASLPEKNPKLRFRILRNGMISDLQHIPNSTLFLSDSFCYMRLIRQGPVNNLSVINKVQVCDLFRKFFDDIWENVSYVDPRREAAEDQMYYASQLVKVQIQVK